MSGDSEIRLIAGLGNPGSEYADTRHNAGFWFVEELARQAGAHFREESKFHGEVARATLAGQDVWLLKPLTYMNRSGQAVQAMASFYKIAPGQILVAHDEVDLPVGVLRLKRGGGHGGNNGLRDIVDHMGRDFLRLRIGVGRPEHKGDMTNHVLKRPSAKEREELGGALDEARRALDVLLSDGLEKAMTALHTRQRKENRKGKPGPQETGKKPASAKPTEVRVAPKKPVQTEPPAERRRAEGDDERSAPASLKEQLLDLFRRNK